MYPKSVIGSLQGALLAIVLFLSIQTDSIAQKNIINRNSVAARQQAIASIPANRQKIRADSIARAMNLPIRRENKAGVLIELQKISSSGLPVYYMSHNVNAAKTTATDKVWNGNNGGLLLDGSNIVVGIWDGGAVKETHVEFVGRVRLIDYLADKIPHATHIAGTIGARGHMNEARGMANNCLMDSYMWGNDSDEMNKAAEEGLLLSNHSYGYLIGWHYNDDINTWEWYGDISVNCVEDYRFGFYDNIARTWDSIAFQHPNYLIVKSAGNDRNEGPPAGTYHKYWTEKGWGGSSEFRYIDGNDGFDCIDPLATGKNILTVGAINDLLSGPEAENNIKIADFSVFGPTDDGRIKPDIIGNGVDLFSTVSFNDTSYAYGSGTSMSAANISGSIALIQQYYFDLFQTYLNASLLKGLIIHTAADKGLAGPDYKYGWGVMNAEKCISIIDNADENTFFNADLNQGDEDIYSFISEGNGEIRITICWTDPPGNVPEPSLDPENKILINDLDIRLIRELDGKVIYPYFLNPHTPDAPALRGDNSLDNVEQILVSNPFPGPYELHVSHKNSLQGGAQNYSVVITGPEHKIDASGINYHSEPNGKILLTTADTYKNNISAKWVINTNNNLPIKLFFEQFSTTEKHDKLKIYDGLVEGNNLIAEFSGKLSNPDTIIQSTGDKMLLVFSSGYQIITSSGFKAYYCSTAPNHEFSLLGNPFPCENTSTDFYLANRDGAQYSWESFRGYHIDALPYNGARISVGSLTDTLTIVPYNLCGQGTGFNKLITPLSRLPETSFIDTNSLLCGDKIVHFRVHETPGTQYHWKLPKTWWGQSDSATLESIPLRGEYKLSVIPENSCGLGDSVFFEMIVLGKPFKDKIYTVDDPICKESVHCFYVKNRPYYSYRWKVFDDWRVIDGLYNDTALIFVGGYANDVQITTINMCGETTNVELFTNEKAPDPPIIKTEKNQFGTTLIYVSNEESFDGIQWYFNDEKIKGIPGQSNPIATNRNGLYTVASVDENGCINKLSADQGVKIYSEKYTYLIYRKSTSSVIVENSSGSAAMMKIYSIKGELVFTAMIQPGKSEISFSKTGCFAVSFVAENIRRNLKVFL